MVIRSLKINLESNRNFRYSWAKWYKISPFSSYGRPSKEEREREEEQREKQENLGGKFKEKVKKSRKQARW
ncbi:Uncharacterized protein TCM_004054 [Theobroma cacao]|uniref:Uncharacterized protein n=1 Tax=Theobroma cacao TaxID=3641 RepID=A0A061DP23_THECC|nr:Uncharacterized protein TCM_004054 [Theobroma cacao]